MSGNEVGASCGIWDFSRMTANYTVNQNQGLNPHRLPAPQVVMQREVLQAVMSRLPVPELRKCRLVCMQWEEEATKMINRKKRIRLWSREEITTHFHENNIIERQFYTRFSIHGDQHTDLDSRTFYLQFLKVFGEQVKNLNLTHPVPGFLKAVFECTRNLQVLHLMPSKMTMQFDDSDYDFFLPELQILRVENESGLFSDELLLMNFVPRAPNINELSLAHLPNSVASISPYLTNLKHLTIKNHLDEKELENLLQCNLSRLETLDLGLTESASTKNVANLFFKVGATLTDLVVRAVPKFQYDDRNQPHKVQDWLKCMWQLKQLRSLQLSWFPDVDPTVLQGHFFSKLSKLVLDGLPHNSLLCASIGNHQLDYEHPRLPNIKTLHIWNSLTAEMAQFHVVDTFSSLTEYHGFITPKSLCVLLTGIPSLKSLKVETFMKRHAEDAKFFYDLSLHAATQDLLSIFQLTKVHLTWKTDSDISEILMILSQRRKLEWLKLEESRFGAGPQVHFEDIKALIDNPNLTFFDFSFKTLKPSLNEFEYIWKKMTGKILYVGGVPLDTENLSVVTSHSLFRLYNKIFGRL